MRRPLCESSACTPSRPPMRLRMRLSASRSRASAPREASAVASERMSMRRREFMAGLRRWFGAVVRGGGSGGACARTARGWLVFREHDDLVAVREGVLLGFLRVHVHAVAARAVVGMLHDAVAD